MGNEDGGRVKTRRPVSVARGGRSSETPAGTPRPRSIEGTRPGRISIEWNVKTPLRSGDEAVVSNPIARGGQCLSGRRTPKKRRPAAERHGESITRRTGPRVWRAGIPTPKGG